MNKVYENTVLESRLTDLLNTKLNTRNLMTIDDSLVESAGMKKKINTYSYTGTVEKLGKGQKNSAKGAVSYISKDYVVELAQQTFAYQDEEVMQDPAVVEMGMKGASQTMVNSMNDDYFREIAKASLVHSMSADFSYDDVVDAISLMNLEDEAGLFLIIGADMKAEVRKCEDFKSARQGEIIFNGQIGNVAGVPVLVSKLVEKGTAFLATKEAVKCFVKKESEVEQARDAETRTNTVVLRKVNLVALVDATKAVKIVKAGK